MLPPTLKRFDLFVDGGSWFGEATSVTLPDLGRETESYRGTFDRPIDIDIGGPALEMEIKRSGISAAAALTLGQVLADGNSVRFVGAYESDDTGWTSAEVYVRGKAKTLSRGEQTVGKVSEESVKYSLTYYREVINGVVTVEIDVLGGIEMVDGVDRLAEARAIIGR